MINYKTKDKGMIYRYEDKAFEINHALFRVNSLEDRQRTISNGVSEYINMTIENNTGIYFIMPFKDKNINLNRGDIIKVAYIVLDDGTIRAHGYELCNDTEEAKELRRSLDELKEEVNLNQVVDIDLLQRRLIDYIDKINNKQLKMFVAKVLTNNLSKFIIWPAAVSVHHNIKSGLLLHTVNVCRIAMQISEDYSLIDKDLVIAGALLHDIGKIREYTEDGKVSHEGMFRDHITLGQEIILSNITDDSLDEDTVNQLIHIILSHHGKLEWGSTKIPSTKEAFVVHIADYIDTQMYIYHNSYKGISFGEDSYNKLLGTHVINNNIETCGNYDV